MEDPRPYRPRNVATTATELALAWADGHESYIPFARLRRACPCAFCRDRREKPPTPSLRVVDGPSLDEIRLVRVEPVGAYGLRLTWSDGHDAGIFDYAFLRRLCPCPRCREAADSAHVAPDPAAR